MFEVKNYVFFCCAEMLYKTHKTPGVRISDVLRVLLIFFLQLLPKFSIVQEFLELFSGKLIFFILKHVMIEYCISFYDLKCFHFQHRIRVLLPFSYFSVSIQLTLSLLNNRLGPDILLLFFSWLLFTVLISSALNVISLIVSIFRFAIQTSLPL